MIQWQSKLCVLLRLALLQCSMKVSTQHFSKVVLLY
jgi:hypothetical protein